MSVPVLLYVEDEDAAFVLFKTALASAGIEVELLRASDGEQALAFLRGDRSDSQRPDLVVLDLNLPRKTGLDVLSEIGQDANLRELRVVVFSSSSLLTDRQKSILLGARGYITKPFTYDGFVEAVRTACSYLPASEISR